MTWRSASPWTYRYIDQLQPESVSNCVVRQDSSALEACVGPPMLVGIGNVQLGDGDGMDLVGSLGDGALDRLLVFVREYRRHGGGFAGFVDLS